MYFLLLKEKRNLPKRKVPITSTHFSTLFILRNRPKYIALCLEPFHGNFAFCGLERRKKWSLIYYQAMKGNGFDTGLT